VKLGIARSVEINYAIALGQEMVKAFDQSKYRKIESEKGL